MDTNRSRKNFVPKEAKEPKEYVFSKTFYGKNEKKPDLRTYRALDDCGCDDRH
ncbi:hypothetical protein ES703_99670 [subsurface metagenome]